MNRRSLLVLVVAAVGFLFSGECPVCSAADGPAAPSPGGAVAAPARGLAEHVVLIVCDGLRPDLVTQKNMPTLFRLSQEGVFFARNHCVYPSSTEVNGTAFATGVFPGTSGITANREYRPGINPRRPIPTESLEAIRGGDTATGGKYIAVSTMAEQIQAAGFTTVVAGTKPVARLHDRSANRSSEASKKSSVVIGGKAGTPELDSELTADEGPFPPVTFPNTSEDAWTTRVLLKHLWKQEVPRFSLLWLSDPDFSQHNTAPGSEHALAALKSDDDNIAAVLAALDARGIRGKTDVFVASDHGFSTIVNPPDMVEELVKAGFSAVRDFTGAGASGQILVVPLGGSVLYYVRNHDAGQIAKLVEFLQKLAYAGPIFTREKADGTFTLDQVRVRSAESPDVLMSFLWSDLPNQFGIPGLILGGSGNQSGRGMHASLSKYDLHNTLIASGPDLRQKMVNELPSGNTDVAPTILALLGITPKQPLEGRVLTEALNDTRLGNGKPVPPPVQTTVEASCKVGGHIRTQSLTVTRFGGTIYFDQGTAESQGTR